MNFTEKAVGFLRGWKRFNLAVEGLLIDQIAATSPWLAPLLPAFMTWSSMTTRLGFPQWVALAGAGVVELLGLSAVTTTVQFWDFNANRRANRAPVFVSGLTAGFYLAVVLTVNVIMDTSPVEEKWAKVLLSSLSVCAALVLALRAGHARRMDAAELERQERKEARLLLKEIRKEAENSGNLPEPSAPARLDWRRLPVEDRDRIRSMSTRQIVQEYQVEERTARNWRSAARNNGYHNEESTN
jgi:hypothetical protein